MNRSRVLEETWEVQRYVVEMAGAAGRQLGQFIDDVDDPLWPSCDRDRAQLASAAPDMARVLLELAGSKHPNDNGYLCPDCFGGDYEPRHHKDCAIMTALRKAGVLT